jgi:hypothetical protein
MQGGEPVEIVEATGNGVAIETDPQGDSPA